jgi:ABC-type nitrate/sulfonate/bicarbonate transport system substrate-binding protein
VLSLRAAGRAIAVCAVGVITTSCGGDDGRLALRVELGTRSVSKLPFVIAEDQGLFRKYGLDVRLRMPLPSDDDAIATHSFGVGAQIWERLKRLVGRGEPPWYPDIYVDGHTPNIVKHINQARAPHRIALAANDCVARAHVIGNTGITSVDQLKGKRLGISARTDTTLGFVGLMLAKRRGWDPIFDLSLKTDGRDVAALRDGRVDAIVASEFIYAEAKKAGYPILEDTSDWNLPIGGNSVLVEKGWLERGTNREAAKRFLQAVIEGLALFHRDRDLALQVMAKWHAVTDPEVAAIAYERGQWLERKPYPCYEGVVQTMQLYDSYAMRQFKATDFYDDSIVKELDASGFIDALYKE